jgi:uncharacterized protein YecT (DUF1311 family)
VARVNPRPSLFLDRTASQLDQNRVIRLHGDAQGGHHGRKTNPLVDFLVGGSAAVHRDFAGSAKNGSKTCWDTATTPLTMNECTGKELRASEQRLASLLVKLHVSPEDAAQKAWEAYRDAQIEPIYPKESSQDNGSVFPLRLAKLKKTLTDGRIAELKNLTRSGEGDVCGGLKSAANRNPGNFGSLSRRTCVAQHSTKVSSAS